MTDQKMNELLEDFAQLTGMNDHKMNELLEHYALVTGIVERAPRYRYFPGSKTGHIKKAHCWNTEPVEEAGGKWWYWVEIEDHKANTIQGLEESRLSFKTRKAAKAWAFEQSQKDTAS